MFDDLRAALCAAKKSARDLLCNRMVVMTSVDQIVDKADKRSTLSDVEQNGV